MEYHQDLHAALQPNVGHRGRWKISYLALRFFDLHTLHALLCGMLGDLKLAFFFAKITGWVLIPYLEGRVCFSGERLAQGSLYA